MSEGLSERDALLILNGLRYVGPILLKRLLSAYSGSAVSVLSSSRKDLLNVDGVGPKAAEALLHWAEHFDLQREKKRLSEGSIHFVDCHADAYPGLLRHTYDPPIGLYWNGEYTIDRPCVAIIGTRRATLYGMRMARQLAGGLARLGFCIVSGLARGVDTAAHQAALESGGPTIAVLGCGLDIIYPPENLELYQKIVAAGAVISEFPFGRRADRQTFPMRNRIIAGLSQGVVVVESAQSGGSMITARFAGEQGKCIMALPGRVDQSSSGGCHQLIRDGATLVTGIEDVLDELGYHSIALENIDEQSETTPTVQLGVEEKALIDAFRGGGVYTVDALSIVTGMAVASVLVHLMALELKGLIAKRSDGCFEARV